METGRAKIRLDLVVEKNGCDMIPWDIIEDNSTGNCKYFENSWSDDASLITHEIWELGLPNAECGDKFHIKGDADVVFTRYWTDCGYEHDIELETDCEVVKIEK